MRGALLVLGLLGTAVLIGAGALGYALGGAAEEQVRSHVLLSLAATLLLIFSHTWIVLYLLATGRVISQAAARYPGGAGRDGGDARGDGGDGDLGASGGARGGDGGGGGHAHGDGGGDLGGSGGAPVAVLLERARRLRLRALPWLLAAIGALAATFLTGSGAAAGSIPAPFHHALFYVTLAAQGAAMLIERRVLAEHDRVGDDLRRHMQADAA